MNIILSKKISEVSQFSKSFRNISLSNGWVYVFDLIHNLDHISKFRGVGRRYQLDLDIFMAKNSPVIEKAKSDLSDITAKISEMEINSFSEIVSSDEFKKLDEFFLELHRKGYSNKRILLSLAEEEIGLLYKPGAYGMNSQLFIQTFTNAVKNDRETLLHYLRLNQNLFIKAYRDKTLEELQSAD